MNSYLFIIIASVANGAMNIIQHRHPSLTECVVVGIVIGVVGYLQEPRK